MSNTNNIKFNNNTFKNIVFGATAQAKQIVAVAYGDKIIWELTTEPSAGLILDSTNAGIAIAYTPATDIVLSTVSVALQKKATNGRGTCYIWHESGVLVAYKYGSLDAWSCQETTDGDVSFYEYIGSDFGTVKLKANNKYYIWLNVDDWGGNFGNYHYYYDTTGEYTIVASPSETSPKTAFSDYNYIHSPTDAIDSIMTLSANQSILYTGTTILTINGTNIHQNYAVGVNKSADNYIGSYSYLPGGSTGEKPTETCTVYLTNGYYDGVWASYFGAGAYLWQNNSWVTSTMSITTFNTPYLSSVNSAQTGRKYYLKVNGDKI